MQNLSEFYYVSRCPRTKIQKFGQVYSVFGFPRPHALPPPPENRLPIRWGGLTLSAVLGFFGVFYVGCPDRMHLRPLSAETILRCARSPSVCRRAARPPLRSAPVTQPEPVPVSSKTRRPSPVQTFPQSHIEREGLAPVRLSAVVNISPPKKESCATMVI